jgi:hypothetical protein
LRTSERQLEWRRSQVLELGSKGHNQSEIARILRVHKSVISRDSIYLRDKARENLQTHLQDRLPAEYESCMTGINQILKMSWGIASKGSNSFNGNSNLDSNSIATSTTTTVDDRTRLQALALANDCYKYKMDLVTNGVVITDAIKFVQQKKEELAKVDIQRT